MFHSYIGNVTFYLPLYDSSPKITLSLPSCMASLKIVARLLLVSTFMKNNVTDGLNNSIVTMGYY